MATCANPGCSEPGTNKCSACTTAPYCGPICQKAHWQLHKESCDGHLHKMGMAHLEKARSFHREHNWSQSLRYCDLAVSKLKQLKVRPVDPISEALCYKCTALSFLGQYGEEMECAKEWYCLWNTKPTDMGAIRAAIALIQSCITNNEFVDAHLYASTLWEIINHKHDNKIPEDQQQPYIAYGAYHLAYATLCLAKNGGIPPEEKQKAGQEVIALVRRALEIRTQLYGTENADVADCMGVLADALSFFNDSDDDNDEVLRLFEQAKDVYARMQGSSSVNVALMESKLSTAYYSTAARALSANDLDRCIANLELSLPRYREAVRIYRAVNRNDAADAISSNMTNVEQQLLRISIARAATTNG